MDYSYLIQQQDDCIEFQHFWFHILSCGQVSLHRNKDIKVKLYNSIHNYTELQATIAVSKAEDRVI